MSGLSYAATDSATMLRRNLTHALRYPALTFSGMLVPIIILLLFVGVLGDTLGAGLGRATAGGAGYVDYVAPGIILMTVASGCMSTSVSVCVDMTGGIINRFRTMAISRASLLTGHVVGSMIQTVISTALVIGVALLLGSGPRGACSIGSRRLACSCWWRSRSPGWPSCSGCSPRPPSRRATRRC